MLQFNLYVGKLLYKTTLNPDEAFSTFKKWSRAGSNVTMKFVRIVSI